MPSLFTPTRIASLLLVAAVATVGAVAAKDNTEYDSAESQIFRLTGALEIHRKTEFWRELSAVRAQRWLADHPDRACPTIHDLATPAEIAERELSRLELVCGDREHFGRRVVVMRER